MTPPAGAEIRTLTADFFVIATGSRPNRPDDVPFDGETVFDSETILQLPRMPRTMTVLGRGRRSGSSTRASSPRSGSR